MLCFDQCKILPCCAQEDEISESTKKIEIVHTQNPAPLPAKVVSESDHNSESDSGVGSVRDSSNDSGKETMKSKIPLKIASSSVKVTRVKSVKRSESLLSRFSFIFPSGGEKLSDILVEEFKKNDRTTGIALERMFSSNSMNSIPEETTAQAPKKQLKKKKSLKQLITGQKEVKKEVSGELQTMQSPPDVPTTPEVDQNREKKKRKKRRMPRKTIEAEESESSSMSSSTNRDRPVMRKQSQKALEKWKMQHNLTSTFPSRNSLS